MTADFDDRLRTALDADDEAFLKRLDDEPGLLRQFGDAFAGSMKFWTGFAFFLSFTMFALSIYALVQLTQVAGETARVMWLAAFIWSTVGVGMTKIWFWMRMNHVATLRELKRIELRLAMRGGDA